MRLLFGSKQKGRGVYRYSHLKEEVCVFENPFLLRDDDKTKQKPFLLNRHDDDDDDIDDVVVVVVARGPP